MLPLDRVDWLIDAGHYLIPEESSPGYYPQRERP